MRDPDPQESLQAVLNATVYRLADDLALLIAVAVERHPEALQKALGKVFSCEAVQHFVEGAVRDAMKAKEIALETRQMLEDFRKELDAARKQEDGREGRMRLQSLEERIELLEAQLQPETR